MKQVKRRWVQAISALAHNPHLANFVTGRIYQGPLKQVCVPGLNCYSCPGATGACPIGSLQAVLGGRGGGVSYYVTGLILLFGLVCARLICGFLCPFGLVQELLHKLPSPKPRLARSLDSRLRWGKYLALAGVVLLPLLARDQFGIGAPAFCKFLCPAGTLEGGVPLLLANPSLRDAAGLLFSWKLALLAVVLVASVLLYRPFCKYLCPLGAIYGLLNRYSLYQMRVDSTACIQCGKCEAICGMGVSVRQNANDRECIRCGRCQQACPAGAIHAGCRSKKADPAPAAK